MSADCIHGLEAALCDQCTPKAAPVASAVTAPAKVTRTRAVRRPAARKSPMISESAAVVDPGTKRIFHLTHLRNLPGILSAGELRADTHGAEPEVDLSSPDNRARRREALLEAGGVVASYVPFFLTPLADVWALRLDKAEDDRLASATLSLSASEFVMLVSTVGRVGKGVVLATGDAAAPSTRFVPLSGDPVTVPRLDDEQEPQAELLVPESLSLNAVTLIGVANDLARGQVREALRSSGFSPKIAVYPPWFQPVERD